MEERDNESKKETKGEQDTKNGGIELDTTTKYRGLYGRRRGPVLPGFEKRWGDEGDRSKSRFRWPVRINSKVKWEAPDGHEERSRNEMR